MRKLQELLQPQYPQARYPIGSRFPRCHRSSRLRPRALYLDGYRKDLTCISLSYLLVRSFYDQLRELNFYQLYHHDIMAFQHLYFSPNFL